MSTTLGANSNAVAEATVGLTLSVLRHLPRGEAMIKRERVWKRESLMGRELGQAVVGIVGCGRIGRLVARYFADFGARVIVTDPSPRGGGRKFVPGGRSGRSSCVLRTSSRCTVH